MKKEPKPNTQSNARSVFLKHQGFLRASEAFASGIHPRDLYALRDQGEIELVARGLFRLASLPQLESPGLFTIGVKIPNGVLCLQSALEFHKLIKQTPNKFSVALLKGSEQPQIHHIPIKFYMISEPAFSEGIQLHRKDGANIRIYSPEKTLADCFKFRNKIGLNMCLEALQAWWKTNKKRPDLLLDFAKTCRIEKIIRPYLDLLTLQDS